MSRGSVHRLDGMLLDTRRGLIVRVGGGGEWLVAPGRHRHALLGQRVVVEGSRIGFGELWLERIARAEVAAAPSATLRRLLSDYLRRAARTICP